MVRPHCECFFPFPTLSTALASNQTEADGGGLHRNTRPQILLWHQSIPRQGSVGGRGAIARVSWRRRDSRHHQEDRQEAGEALRSKLRARGGRGGAEHDATVVNGIPMKGLSRAGGSSLEEERRAPPEHKSFSRPT
ncbi:hypothetical protein E2C01_059378 [Portunus trituberculatus]|uniref:Uncharacterized protein n=1 Tax=Portunus trituberculatus TaxID=210409 RepID=A0A5B7H6K6_PORTR|nr:hypothetical protein [Portunus trituberculatus]